MIVSCSKTFPRGSRQAISEPRPGGHPQLEASSLVGVSCIANSGGTDAKDGRAQALVGSAM